MQVRVFGFKVFDSENGGDKPKKTKAGQEDEETNSDNIRKKVLETDVENEESKPSETTHKNIENNDADDFTAWEIEMEAEAKEEAELAKQIAERKIEVSEENTSEKVKKSLSEKIEDIKSKIQDMLRKIKDFIAKIQDGKLKVEHYLELWNKEETQITFDRAKNKLGRMIKALLPQKWKVTGEIGFNDPCATGQLMGALGAMYPILGNKVQIVPDFEEQVINLEGNLKGHIRLGNLLYQLVSLLLNRYCFKFIKLIFDELGSSKKGKKKQEA